MARVVAVADAFHAMVSHRPYSPGVVGFHAVQEIKVLAGEQFDPAVARALVELWDGGEVAKFSMRPAESRETRDILAHSVSLPAPSLYAE